MMEPLYWLLFPAGIASGWALRSWYYSVVKSDHPPENSAAASSQEYYRGLTFLLNEQRDQALDVFLNVAKIDGAMVETHLAVGSLFRRRGEVDRALRVHQNLIARPNLSSYHRADAMFELGHDYLAAGLFDRSERIFQDLIQKGDHSRESYEALVLIYERQREWHKSIEAAKQCYKVTGVGKRTEIAQYYCELAYDSKRQNNFDKMTQYLKDALWFDKNCARASMMLGDLESANGRYVKAIEYYEAVEKQDPSRVPDVAESLFLALKEGKDTLPLQRLRDRLGANLASYTILSTATRLVKETEGPEAARDFFREQLLKHPSLRGLRDWAKMEMERSNETNKKQVGVVVDMLDKILNNKPTHACQHCGFRGRQLYWHCPSCGRWDSIKAVTGFEGEGN